MNHITFNFFQYKQIVSASAASQNFKNIKYNMSKLQKVNVAAGNAYHSATNQNPSQVILPQQKSRGRNHGNPGSLAPSATLPQIRLRDSKTNRGGGSNMVMKPLTRVNQTMESNTFRSPEMMDIDKKQRSNILVGMVVNEIEQSGADKYKRLVEDEYVKRKIMMNNVLDPRTMRENDSKRTVQISRNQMDVEAEVNQASIGSAAEDYAIHTSSSQENGPLTSIQQAMFRNRTSTSEVDKLKQIPHKYGHLSRLRKPILLSRHVKDQYFLKQNVQHHSHKLLNYAQQQNYVENSQNQDTFGQAMYDHQQILQTQRNHSNSQLQGQQQQMSTPGMAYDQVYNSLNKMNIRDESNLKNHKMPLNMQSQDSLPKLPQHRRMSKSPSSQQKFNNVTNQYRDVSGSKESDASREGSFPQIEFKNTIQSIQKPNGKKLAKKLQQRQPSMDDSNTSDRLGAGYNSHRSDARDTTDQSVTASHKHFGRPIKKSQKPRRYQNIAQVTYEFDRQGPGITQFYKGMANRTSRLDPNKSKLDCIKFQKRVHEIFGPTLECERESSDLLNSIKIQHYNKSIHENQEEIPDPLGDDHDHSKVNLESKIFLLLKKRVFNNFQKPIDYRVFCDHVQKFVSMDLVQIKELFFNFLDVGKDGKICETDLFEVFRTLDTICAQKLLQADLQILMKFMNRQRARTGWSNPHDQAKKDLENNIQRAMETGIVQQQPNHVVQVRKFLGEVAVLQEKLKRREEMQNKDQEFKNPGDITFDDAQSKKQQKDEEVDSIDLTEEIIVPAEMKPYINREINFNLFQEILMERRDKGRAYISFQEFLKIDFIEMGMPRYITRIFAFLLQEQHQSMVIKKAKQLYDDETFQRLLPVDPIKEEEFKNDDEIFELRNMQQILEGTINFPLYEALFRTMCRNPYVDSNWNLQADVNSINKGLKPWYGNQDNMPVAYILFNYMGKGKVNHIVTFSEFITVIRDLQLSRIHVNLLVFKMITEGQRELGLLKLLRQYVCTPKGSDFAKEMYKMIEYYMKMHLSATPGMRSNRSGLIHTISFDKFNELVNNSCLGTELVNKLIKLPHSCFDAETASLNYPFEEKKEELQGSCMFSPDHDQMDPSQSQSWHQSRQMWNKMKGGKPIQDEEQFYKKLREDDDEIRSQEKLFKLNVNDENLDGIIRFWIREERAKSKRKKQWE